MFPHLPQAAGEDDLGAVGTANHTIWDILLFGAAAFTDFFPGVEPSPQAPLRFQFDFGGAMLALGYFASFDAKVTRALQ